MQRRWVAMSERIIECADIALNFYDVEKIKTHANVFEVINEYWNTISELVTEVLSNAVIDLSIANVVWDMVYRLREKIDEEGVDFWRVKGVGSVVGWIEEGEVIAKVLVDVMSKKILVTVEGKQGNLTWKVALEAGEWLIPEFTFSVAMNLLKEC
jgi:hypothetical protein